VTPLGPDHPMDALRRHAEKAIASAPPVFGGPGRWLHLVEGYIDDGGEGHRALTLQEEDYLTAADPRLVAGLVAAVRAVLDRHRPDPGWRHTGQDHCWGCATRTTITPWPCATVTAITTALTPTPEETADA
jgi:hypothetical protein